jgi:small subunit ribosomal protein S16
MAVRIRLTRKGMKKKPFYRLVAADSECPRDGKFLEILGTYNPMTDPAQVDIKMDRVNYWIEKGAVATEAANAILKKEGDIKASAEG